jgi:undecaprenyl-diphosphatase
MARWNAVAALRFASRWIDRFHLREVSVLLMLLVVIGGTWLFIELADEVHEGETQRVDEWVVRAMRQVDDPTRPIGPHWLASAARDITALGSSIVLLLVTSVVAGYLLLIRKHHAMWLVIIASIGGQLVSSSLKAIVGRERPSVVPHLTDVTSASFPSGHSMISAVVYMTLGALLMRLTARRRQKVYIISVALVMMMLVGLSRIYLGVHYPTDVLGGWTAGLVWALLCWVVADYLQRRGAVESAS